MDTGDIQAAELQRHVYTLAGDIGERNVYRPQALRAAESYIEAEWQAQGYAVERQVYQVGKVSCANLEISIPGHGHSACHSVSM